MPENVMEIKRRLLTLLKDVNLVNTYLRKFGPVINARNINAIKYGGKGAMNTAAPAVKPAAATASATPAAAGPAGPAVNAAGERDPVYESKVSCPVCGRSGITCYELRPKTMQVTQTIYLVPEYTGASGYATVDYSRIAVTVCPDCLYASPDRKNFNFPSFSGKGEEPSTMPMNVILNMKDSTEKRKTLMPHVVGNPEYFNRDRTVAAGIEAYRLAIVRAEEEAELLQPYAYFKIGSYLLKIAYMQKKEGQDNNETMAAALKAFEKSYTKSECANEDFEMQALYLTVALSIRTGDLNKANSYLTSFSKLIAERKIQKKSNPSLTTQWIEKWQDKARFLWEERETPGYFDK